MVCMVGMVCMVCRGIVCICHAWYVWCVFMGACVDTKHGMYGVRRMHGMVCMAAFGSMR